MGVPLGVQNRGPRIVTSEQFDRTLWPTTGLNTDTPNLAISGRQDSRGYRNT